MGRRKSAKKLGEMLIGAGLLSAEQLVRALAEQERSFAPLGVKLIALGMVHETDLLHMLSAQLDAPVAQLDGRRIPKPLIDLVPLETAEQYGCIPLFMRTSGKLSELFLGMLDPTDVAAIDAIRFLLGCRVRPVLVLHGQLMDAIHRHYRDDQVGQDEVLANDFEAFAPEIHLAEAAPELDTQPQPGESGFTPASETLFQPVRSTDAESTRDPPSSRAVLRALIELLVERRVLAPGDIQERIRRGKRR
jgi:hypothetical protein